MMKPCGAPEDTGGDEEEEPFTTTCCARFRR